MKHRVLKSNNGASLCVVATSKESSVCKQCAVNTIVFVQSYKLYKRGTCTRFSELSEKLRDGHGIRLRLVVPGNVISIKCCMYMVHMNTHTLGRVRMMCNLLRGLTRDIKYEMLKYYYIEMLSNRIQWANLDTRCTFHPASFVPFFVLEKRNRIWVI